MLTDEDSADEDEGGAVDNLSGRQLLANAEIKLTNNTVISSIVDGNNSFDFPRPSTSTQSITPPDHVHDSSFNNSHLTVSHIDSQIDGNIRNNKTSTLVMSLMSEKNNENDAKKKNTFIDKSWISGDLEPSNITFPNPDFSKYKDFSAYELFKLFFDDAVLTCFWRKLLNMRYLETALTLK